MIHGYVDTGIKEYKEIGIQGYRDTGLQVYSASEKMLQEHRNALISVCTQRIHD